MVTGAAEGAERPAGPPLELLSELTGADRAEGAPGGGWRRRSFAPRAHGGTGGRRQGRRFLLVGSQCPVPQRWRFEARKREMRTEACALNRVKEHLGLSLLQLRSGPRQQRCRLF